MKKRQFFCIGASSLYGVGGSSGGWPDLLKQQQHKKMYADNFEESTEVYNLGVSGATIQDMAKRVRADIESRKKPTCEAIVILQLGSNDSKAIDSPDGFISDPEKYRKEIGTYLKQVSGLADEAYCLGMTPVVEAKTAPRKNPWTGKSVYFTNERIKIFEDSLAAACKEASVSFYPIFEAASKGDWTEKYVAVDGLHPNDDGHRWLLEKVLSLSNWFE